MNAQTKGITKVIGIVFGVVVVIVLLGVLGNLLFGFGSVSDSRQTAPATVDTSSPSTVEPMPDVTEESAVSDGSPVSAGKTAADSMLVRTADAQLTVDDVDDAVIAVRALAARNGAEIQSLYLSQPADDGPRPLGDELAYSAPPNAQITLRVPAQNLDAIMAGIQELGTVISQNTATDDVTQQHVDLAARLANLRAQETRLRELLGKAVDVKDVLAVEAELSRVRGEVESMQAQLDYLDRQVERATLSLSLTEKGAIISPEGTDWGFREAVTRGLRGAVTLLNGTLTFLIAISPLVLLAAIVLIVIRVVRKRRAE